jgi:hypothetical protein
MIRNPFRDILVVGAIISVATSLFVEYVKYYERKYGKNKR